MVQGKKVGLALSGGGYRAAAYHLGTLRKLHEMGALKFVDVLSTISGGSITGAAYCLHNGSFDEFEEKLYDTLATKDIISHVLRSGSFLKVVSIVIVALLATILLAFSILPWLALSPIPVAIFLIARYQFQIFPVSAVIEKAYDNFFFKGATLDNLAVHPEIAIGSTNLQTCRHFTFSKRKMEDSTYSYYKPAITFKSGGFPVAKAVMASTCVPFAFTPVSIDIKYYNDPKQYNAIDPKLVDGGVYDNQGIHKLTQNNSSYACDIVIVSDAGNKLPFKKSYNNTFTLLLRTVETFMARIKNFQMMYNIYVNNPSRCIAYHSLGWDVQSCIVGFYEAIKSNNVHTTTLDSHGIINEWRNDCEKYKDEIIQRLEQVVGYEHILNSCISPDKIQRIRSIKTSLRPISKDLLDDIISYSGTLTELQVRLYCPALVSGDI